MRKLHSLHFLAMITFVLIAWHFSWFGLSDDTYGAWLVALMVAVCVHVFYLARNGGLAYENC